MLSAWHILGTLEMLQMVIAEKSETGGKGNVSIPSHSHGSHLLYITGKLLPFIS